MPRADDGNVSDYGDDYDDEEVLASAELAASAARLSKHVRRPHSAKATEVLKAHSNRLAEMHSAGIAFLLVG